ncbi:hypothetical protein [Risungbinella massiliensis]|nr:hypothetical protein [Risungbinella massiliensis]
MYESHWSTYEIKEDAKEATLLSKKEDSSIPDDPLYVGYNISK